MKEPTFEFLFPIPVMFNTLDRNFTTSELDYMNSHSDKIIKNEGNISSINKYILNEPELADLKLFVQEHVEAYVTKVYKPLHPVRPYITQSWLNWTNAGEYHHSHEHPNSFISGVLYINADPAEDKIKFHSKGYQQIYLETNNHDIFNARSWWFGVKTGGILLFPSSLTHNVDKVTSGETRISIAFNTFLKGIIGDHQLATELINE